jgi:hypothetical protein
MDCEATDFIYPMMADLYYATIEQNEYGQPKKSWIYDRTIVCNATPAGGAATEEIKPEIFLQNNGKLIARVKSDPRISSQQVNNSMTNILVTNIKNASGEVIYKETTGPRSGRATIYEFATVEPFIGPFGDIQYYKLLWRRAENQSVGD